MTILTLRDLGLVGVASGGYDSDAAAYIAAVEAADTQGLETAVKDAINTFVLGCKADGTWNAIKASCILAGARTLSGALVPLVGTAPTNVNFVSGDYNRKTGLVGNGSTKYLNSNRQNAADSQNNKHISVYVSTAHSVTGYPAYIGGGTQGYNGLLTESSSGKFIVYISSETSGIQVTSQGSTAGFKGASRSNATTVSVRTGSSTTSGSQASSAPTGTNTIAVFADNYGSVANYSNARLAFFSIGESLDLALLDARVTTLINAFAAAIP
jgi:hypothetical protein